MTCAHSLQNASMSNAFVFASPVLVRLKGPAHMRMEEAAPSKLSFTQRLYPLGFRRPAWKLVKLTVPFAASYILSSWLIEFVSLVFMSRLGQSVFNACALANTIYLLVGYAILLGYNFGCDTLLPQYFGGNKRQMSAVLQRATVIAVYPCLISVVLMLNAKYALQWIEPSEYIVSLVDRFLKAFILIVPLTNLSLSLRVYIGTTGRTWAIVGANILGNVVNALAHYICLYRLHLGIYSAPISMTLAYAAIVLCYALFIRFSSLHAETWQPITRDCLREWKLHLQYAIPGVLIMLTELWSVETSILFAVRLSDNSLSAQSVAQQTMFVVYLVVLALGDAANILIGEKIGANSAQEARNAKNVIYTVTAGVVMCDASMILLCHRWLPYLFNVQGSALLLAQKVLLIIPVVNIFDGYHVVQTGIAKACGMQKWTSVIFLVGFGVVGIPIAVLTTFVLHLDVFGFWMGMISAEIVTGTLLFILLYRFDWDAYTQRVVDRVASKCEPLPAAGEEQHLLTHRSSEEKAVWWLCKWVALFVLLGLFLISAVESYW